MRTILVNHHHRVSSLQTQPRALARGYGSRGWTQFTNWITVNLMSDLPVALQLLNWPSLISTRKGSWRMRVQRRARSRSILLKTVRLFPSYSLRTQVIVPVDKSHRSKRRNKLSVFKVRFYNFISHQTLFSNTKSNSWPRSNPISPYRDRFLWKDLNQTLVRVNGFRQ